MSSSGDVCTLVFTTRIALLQTSDTHDAHTPSSARLTSAAAGPSYNSDGSDWSKEL